MSARARAALVVCSVGLGAALAACGQKGALYMPTAPEAKGRATLPQTLLPTPEIAAPLPAPAVSGAAR